MYNSQNSVLFDDQNMAIFYVGVVRSLGIKFLKGIVSQYLYHKKRSIWSKKRIFHMFFYSFPTFYAKRSNCSCWSSFFDLYLKLMWSIQSFSRSNHSFDHKKRSIRSKNHDWIPNPAKQYHTCICRLLEKYINVLTCCNVIHKLFTS